MDNAWRLLDEQPEGFDDVLGPIMVRAVGTDAAEAIFTGGPTRLNVHKGYHGGFLASAAEKCLVLPLYLHGHLAHGGVVAVNFALQYVQQVDPMIDLLARVSMDHQTGKLAFIRGELTQGDKVAVTFSGTVRKLSHAALR